MRAPWFDRGGRFSPLRAATLAALFVPMVLVAVDVAGGRYDVRPIVELQRDTGLWTLRLLLITLAVTPLRQILVLPQLIVVRRLIGVGTFCYACVHLAAYLTLKGFDPGVVAGELRQFAPLPLGLCVFAILLALAVTSSDAMVRRLGGRRWQRLHRLAYAAIGVAILHAVLEMKLLIDQPAVIAGLLVWLMGYRVVLWRRGVERATAVPTLAVLTLAAAALTMLGEAAYLHWRTHGSALLVLRADFTFVAGVRPGWYVLAAGLALTAAGLASSRRRPWPARLAAAARPAGAAGDADASGVGPAAAGAGRPSGVE